LKYEGESNENLESAITRSLIPNLNVLKRPGKAAAFFLRCLLSLIYPEGGGKKFPRNVVCSEDGGGKFIPYLVARRYISEDLILITRIFSV